MIKLTIETVESLMEGCPAETEARIRDRLSYQVRQYGFSMWEKPETVWLYDEKTGLFLTGFLPIVESILSKHGLDYTLDDRTDHLVVRKEDCLRRLARLPVKPRGYQVDGFVEGLKMRRGGYWWGTGAGKTLLMAMFVMAFDVPALILVENKSLADQIKGDVEEFSGEEVGWIGGGQWLPKKWTVGIVDSFRIREGTFGTEKAERILHFCKKQRLLLVDEHHHEGSNEFIEAAGYCLSAAERFGFSGTPYRTDGRDLYLKGLSGPIIHKKPLSSLIREGYIARPHIFMPRITWRPDIDKEIPPIPQVIEMEYLVKNRQRNRIGVKFILSHYRKAKQILVVVERKKHGRIIRQRLYDAGVSEDDIRYVHGDHSLASRRAARDAFKARRIKILIATRIFHEGMNLPVVDALVNFAGGKSRIRTMQILGRALRKHMLDGEIDIDRKRNQTVYVLDFMDRNHKQLKRHARHRLGYYRREPEIRVELL